MYLHDNSKLQDGKYKIVRFISSGGFGCTYEAYHTLLNARVAIKEFFVKDFCNRDEATSRISVATQSKVQLVAKLREKFIAEAKTLFGMNHPNIVRVIDVFEQNNTAYYVMEYIDGVSLHDMLKKHGPMPENMAVGFVLQICDALEYVHGQNRLHLDIKPGNIMVDGNGTAKLIDFGASKHYDDESGENTSTLLGVNTRGYAPVEQVTTSFSTFNGATDIYALGATLYKLLTGITPPDSVSLMSEESTLAPIPGHVSPTVRHAVEEAMRIRRKDRPQTIAEFRALLKGEGQPAAQPDVDEDGTAYGDKDDTIPASQIAGQPTQPLNAGPRPGSQPTQPINAGPRPGSRPTQPLNAGPRPGSQPTQPLNVGPRPDGRPTQPFGPQGPGVPPPGYGPQHNGYGSRPKKSHWLLWSSLLFFGLLVVLYFLYACICGADENFTSVSYDSDGIFTPGCPVNLLGKLYKWGFWWVFLFILFLTGLFAAYKYEKDKKRESEITGKPMNYGFLKGLCIFPWVSLAAMVIFLICKAATYDCGEYDETWDDYFDEDYAPVEEYAAPVEEVEEYTVEDDWYADSIAYEEEVCC